jgi:hypothetical protein
VAESTSREGLTRKVIISLRSRNPEILHMDRIFIIIHNNYNNVIYKTKKNRIIVHVPSPEEKWWERGTSQGQDS